MMFDGFSNLRKLLVPYETYLTDQRHITEYLRALQAEQEFTLYLNWCHAYKECNRLQFSDLLIKPMQRLTKYSLLLNRITTYCGDYEQKEALVAMEQNARDFVAEINRKLRQQEETEIMEKCARCIEPYEPDHKDEELDLIFRKFAAANIMGEVLNTRGQQIRSLVMEGYFRFKDHTVKETEVKVFLFSDMVLVCKKQKGGVPYRMIRPRYWLQRLSYHPRLNRATKQLCGLNFLQVDETGASISCFSLSESTKDCRPLQTFLAWDYKIRLALATYELSVWAAHHPERSLNDIQAPRAGDPLLDSEARETVASMRRARLTGSLDGAGAAPATCRQTGYGTSGHQLSPSRADRGLHQAPSRAVRDSAECTEVVLRDSGTETSLLQPLLRFGRPSSPQPSSSQSPSSVKPYCLQSLPDLTFEHSFANRRSETTSSESGAGGAQGRRQARSREYEHTSAV
ncbi:pleckstrin homology domain-containing family G member 6-like [Leptidea sinapis]|uniref:pleckstrin homology domain-containing family G member 6-like n=1 Tax=Leptidea sinapis TaxID=189913 RepID=UPI0021C2D980|nr:pleckstrin homology domain-containing family G member 6-like [Leptidea sinapis]